MLCFLLSKWCLTHDFTLFSLITLKFINLLTNYSQSVFFFIVTTSQSPTNHIFFSTTILTSYYSFQSQKRFYTFLCKHSRLHSMKLYSSPQHDYYFTSTLAFSLSFTNSFLIAFTNSPEFLTSRSFFLITLTFSHSFSLSRSQLHIFLVVILTTSQYFLHSHKEA